MKKKAKNFLVENLELLGKNDEASKVAAFHVRSNFISNLENYALVPPGSILDKITKEFETGSHNQIEIPIFTFLSIFATALLQRSITIGIRGRSKVMAQSVKITDVAPFLWFVILAGSGSMKTATFNILLKALGIDEEAYLWDAGNIRGGAAFIQHLNGYYTTNEDGEVETLIEPNNLKLMTIDEFGEFRREINSAGPLAQLSRYFLLLYDSKPIQREIALNGKRKYFEGKVKPCCNFIGFSVADNFVEGIQARELVNGFMQRFSYIWAVDERALKPFINVHLKIKGDWKKILKSIAHDEYIVSAPCIRMYEDFHAKICASAGDVPKSYLLRIFWTLHKIALLYHFILNKGKEQKISTEAYEYALRIISRNISDTNKLFRAVFDPDLNKLVNKVEEYCKRTNIAIKDLPYRKMISNIRGVGNLQTAKAVKEILATDAATKPERENSHVSRNSNNQVKLQSFS